MKAIRDNTHKKKIIEKIFNKLGLPRNLIAKIIDDVFIVLISNINSKKSIKIKNFGTFLLKKKIKELVEVQKMVLNTQYQKEMF